MECQPKKVKHKISVTIEAGYRCAICGYETVVYGDVAAPETCLHCGAPKPTLVWKDSITNKTTVETLPL